MNDANLKGWNRVQLRRGTPETLARAVVYAIVSDDEFRDDFWSRPFEDVFGPLRPSFTFRMGATQHPCFFHPGGSQAAEHFPELVAHLLEIRDFFGLHPKPFRRAQKERISQALIYLPEDAPSRHEQIEMALDLRARLEEDFASTKRIGC